MNQELLVALIGLFLITSFTNVLATLKTILMSKKIMNPVYIVVFIDAMIFATVVTKVTSSNGIHFTIAYALGKTLGVFIGNKFEERLALGILEVDIFVKNKNKMIAIAEMLRTEGYSVNNYLARGINGDRRYKIEAVIKRKEFKNLEQIIHDCGVSEPTLKVKNVSKVNGKLTVSRAK
ncbi:hypothetical protein IMX26_16100 [Clostridium sp. 'deep sea']|uniref:DUF5698 domain-containing protein n=1 Tax=Clostridium sp. 'deep sea' TaxID=2779445 RepID=UPI001896950A|nr:DUF5698 domain-containing protein [Clostridium sp. 'deep sea']QOR34961.1 hypothetical protein IMX26_16100 [Clostridium sp. 'deep sea']